MPQNEGYTMFYYICYAVDQLTYPIDLGWLLATVMLKSMTNVCFFFNFFCASANMLLYAIQDDMHVYIYIYCI